MRCEVKNFYISTTFKSKCVQCQFNQLSIILHGEYDWSNFPLFCSFRLSTNLPISAKWDHQGQFKSLSNPLNPRQTKILFVISVSNRSTKLTKNFEQILYAPTDLKIVLKSLYLNFLDHKYRHTFSFVGKNTFKNANTRLSSIRTGVKN